MKKIKVCNRFIMFFAYVYVRYIFEAFGFLYKQHAGPN